ncbi:hypothetical protein Tsubulata_019948 [Turnera subulata]|uniref:Uncharacterized protein n=1 Tax=Turnera subulata TaxID=218843 RepID=A0A9Q0GK40_9ROSI|nr:hypothetical protein Tsubulata_019948 [Turnera subulata]
MSKKKTASTMSLKDFHGGSIPSDLPLPSAPGVLAKSGPDRNSSTTWGNNLTRSDLRPRPKSSGAARNFDEKASFLSHPTPIGRNFDEDERKPLDGSSAPRRTISDESLRGSAPVRQELKLDYASTTRVHDRPLTSPVLQSPSSGSHPSQAPQSSSWSSGQVGNPKHPRGHDGQVADSNRPNAWGLRKEVTGINEAGGSLVSSGPNTVSKFAQVSALEKVSSGMWQSKPASLLVPHQVYSENNNVTPSVDMGVERDNYRPSHGSQAESGRVEKLSPGTRQSKNFSHYMPHMAHSEPNNVNHSVDVSREKVSYVASRGSQTETDWVVEDRNQGGGRKLPNYRRDPPQKYTEEVHAGATTVGSHVPASMPPEVSERPKLNLLPRSKPLEASENDYRQGYQRVTESAQNENTRQLIGNGNPNPPKAGLPDAKNGSLPAEGPVERPKLNLKPRSQPVEQSVGSLERARNNLFGGARPRELVLKERGIDDIAINNQDLSHSPDRVNSPKNQLTSEHSVQTAGHGQRVDNRVSNRRTAKDFERKDQRMDHEKADVEKRNWRNDKWKNNRDAKDQRLNNRDAKDQRPEPETWRKHVQEPNSASSDASGTRTHGKLASALELVHVFSKSVSDPRAHNSHTTQRGVPGHNSQPFSRLTDSREHYSAPTTRHRINGY